MVGGLRKRPNRVISDNDKRGSYVNDSFCLLFFLVKMHRILKRDLGGTKLCLWMVMSEWLKSSRKLAGKRTKYGC